MGIAAFLIFGFLVVQVDSLARSGAVELTSHDSETVLLNRSSFPTCFIFGTASSSYQYEGAAYEDGRGPSIWDTFTHKFPVKPRNGLQLRRRARRRRQPICNACRLCYIADQNLEKIADRSNRDVAVDSYHRYKEDVGIMKEMGLDAYRFSISWPRLLPYGKLSRGVNREGINYNNNLINELLSNGEFHGAKATFSSSLGSEQAEALAVWEAISWARSMNISNLSIESDAEKIVKAINRRESGINWSTKSIIKDCLFLLESFNFWQCNHINRNSNRIADKLAKVARNQHLNKEWYDTPPLFLEHVTNNQASQN